MLVEAVLVAFTVFALVQPFAFMKPKQTERRTVGLQMVGLVLLCITFCWSVIFGCVLALNEITFRL
jgi:hypothetical protein